MQTFVFSLEKTLRWRSAQHELENSRLVTLEHERVSIAKLIARLAEARQKAVLAIAGCASISGSEMLSVAQYRDTAGFHLKRLDQRLRDCEQRIRQQRNRAVEVGRAKKLLEELRRREYEAWNYAFQRELENTASELYLARWPQRDQT